MPRTRLLSNTQPEVRGLSKTLVVVLHGIERDLRDWCEAVREFSPDADLLIPQYDSGVLSNVDPRQVANHLAQYIQDADASRSERPDGGAYDRIILIGYSAGGLIVRKAYLIAMGYGDDEEIVQDSKPLPWVKKVERVILMAAINRGLSTSKKPENASWLMHNLRNIGMTITPFFGFGNFVSCLRQGSPFVANLRVQWIRLSHASGVQLPLTIQLLGDVDDVVSEEDNVDLLADDNFKYLKLRDTGHADIRNFHDEAVGSHRKAQFQKALSMSTTENSDTHSIQHLIQHRNAQAKDHVVFVMHGIRDMGRWKGKISETLEAVAEQLGQTVDPIVSGYGYFPMLSFLFLGARQRNVRWFMDEYTEAIARCPNAQISFIGHSNGTYLLASALKRYHSCRVHRVAFAGSVVPKDYPWDELVGQGRVQAVRNDVASADWVVGIFPGFFELLKLGDLGTAGHNGFVDDAPQDGSFDKYFKGGHGAAIQPGNHQSLARFILSGEKVVPEAGMLVEQQSSLVVLLSKLCWLVLLLIVATVGLVGLLATWLLSLAGVPLLLAWIIYAGFVLMLLYTI